MRDPWGLFVDPTYFDTPGSVYSTAMIDSALGRPASEAADISAVVERLCASRESEQVDPLWFSWAMATVFGRDGAACVQAAQPENTGNPGNDVPRYFAWVSAQLAFGADKEQFVTGAQSVLAERRLAEQRPYVMWRADQLEDLLGFASTAADRPAAGPQGLDGPDDLTELWGYTMRCERRAELCPRPSAVGDEAVAAAAVAYPDDLSFAGALSVLRVRGASGYVAELTKSVDARRIHSDGLLRSSRFTGTIDASFAVLQLDREAFPGPDPEISAAEITRRLRQVPSGSTVTRLRALALLKVIDSDAWKPYEEEIQAIYRRLDGSRIDESSLKEFVDVATAFGQMEVEAPMARLRLFDAIDDETAYLARFAVGNSWALTNSDEVLRHFDKVRSNALAQAKEPAEPVAYYVAGLQALNGEGIEIDQQDQDAISVALDSSLRGCRLDGRMTDELYRFNLDKSSACSLTVTVDVVKSGFGGQ